MLKCIFIKPINNIGHLNECEVTSCRMATDGMQLALHGPNYEVFFPPVLTFLNLNLIKPCDVPSNPLMFQEQVEDYTKQ